MMVCKKHEDHILLDHCRMYCSILVDTNNKLIEGIKELREVVWMEDIPHPTIPEYRELHEKITKILTFIDSRLLKE